VKLKHGPFVGSEALAKVKAEGITRKLVGLRMVGRGIARHGYDVLDAKGAKIGAVTSGSPGPSVGANIGLAYVPVSHAEAGTRVDVAIRRKTIEAVVVDTPFYRRPR
jgi:aminomethyltransferase